MEPLDTSNPIDGIKKAINTDAVASQVEKSLFWLPDWGISLVVFAFAVLVAIFLHRLVFRILTRLVAGRDLFWRSLVSRTEGPMKLAIGIVLMGFAASISPLSGGQAEVIRHGLQLCFIVLLAWMAQTALHIWTTVYLRRFKLDAEDNLLARKHVTQSRILQRVGNLMIGIIAIAALLMTFESVRQYGVSLLASAGAAGLVVGLALQPVLKNLFAGIQLAVTQPIRIDDALLVEGEWGNVEEITSTYVVIRIWDWRRLILPLSYFIEQPFQNWTREGAALIGTVMLYLDYTVPVDVIRAQVDHIAKTSPLWDGKVAHVQVTDFREHTMEIRILISASNSPRTYDIRCEVRERLITYLQQNYPECLPRLRAELRQPTADPSAQPQMIPMREVAG
ncbi:Small-conductance mechanosensitive channel [Hartmannibacter diazotrophicus]|uniref:Small-conductance mechanosensitive channel n=1 Tax=Hartmannibacter diazotrophicus TaxID=1482074 RepID=A0A2C9DBN2_9HYPH|nr:mechanosensitive ion channel domain-containing protein [Hartmannibacter diazotrophicus]SON57015.1 Small-conductance mechanosensitive channel [Hartmannibacter diazotrophicus]